MREEEEAQKKFFTFFSPLSVLSLVLSLCKRKRAPTLINKEAQHTKKHEGASIAFKSKKQEEEEQKRQEIYTRKRSAEGQKQQH